MEPTIRQIQEGERGYMLQTTVLQISTAPESGPKAVLSFSVRRNI